MQNHAEGEVAAGHEVLQQTQAEPLLSRDTWEHMDDYFTIPAQRCLQHGKVIGKSLNIHKGIC